MSFTPTEYEKIGNMVLQQRKNKVRITSDVSTTIATHSDVSSEIEEYVPTFGRNITHNSDVEEWNEREEEWNEREEEYDPTDAKLVKKEEENISPYRYVTSPGPCASIFDSIPIHYDSDAESVPDPLSSIPFPKPTQESYVRRDHVDVYQDHVDEKIPERESTPLYDPDNLPPVFSPHKRKGFGVQDFPGKPGTDSSKKRKEIGEKYHKQNNSEVLRGITIPHVRLSTFRRWFLNALGYGNLPMLIDLWENRDDLTINLRDSVNKLCSSSLDIPVFEWFFETFPQININFVASGPVPFEIFDLAENLAIRNGNFSAYNYLKQRFPVEAVIYIYKKKFSSLPSCGKRKDTLTAKAPRKKVRFCDYEE